MRGLKSLFQCFFYCWRSRTPHGVRGLKYFRLSLARLRRCRTPHGVRGLKYSIRKRVDQRLTSHPTRGAWIEINPPLATAKREPKGFSFLHYRNAAEPPTPRRWRRHTRSGGNTDIVILIPIQDSSCKTSKSPSTFPCLRTIVSISDSVYPK